MCTFHLKPLAVLQPILIHTQLKPNIDATLMGRLVLPRRNRGGSGISCQL